VEVPELTADSFSKPARIRPLEANESRRGGLWVGSPPLSQMAQPHGASHPILYLDESGDLGFNFSVPGASRHLTIAFIATTNSTELKRVVRDIKRNQGIGGSTELKGYNTRFEIREELARRLARLPVEIHAVTVYKPNVETRLREDTNIFYNYVAGLVLVPYICKQSRITTCYDARKIKVKTGFDIDPYIRYKVLFEEKKNVIIFSQHLNSATSLAIQASDIVTNAIFRKYENGDNRLASILQPIHVRDSRLFFP
jgi:hypothetical protein